MRLRPGSAIRWSRRAMRLDPSNGASETRLLPKTGTELGKRGDAPKETSSMTAPIDHLSLSCCTNLILELRLKIQNG
ncbi:hypothetical protein ACFX15_023804 [Malus domestica]